MKQTRLQSLVETLVSIAVGFVIALIAQIYVAGYFGWGFDLWRDLQITAFFTVISIARGYCIRRFFNWYHWRQNDKTKWALPSENNDCGGSSR